MKENLAKILFEKSFPLSVDEIKSDIKFNAINEKNNDYAIILKERTRTPIVVKASEIDKQGITKNDVVITVMYSKTHPKEGVMVYKISFMGKSLVYATDKESYTGGDKSLSTFARETDLLIHDSQYTQIDYNSIANNKQGFGHSSFVRRSIHSGSDTAKVAGIF